MHILNILIVIIGIVAMLGFEAWMIIDAMQNKKLKESDKALWIIGMLLFHPVITIVYFFVASTKRKK